MSKTETTLPVVQAAMLNAVADLPAPLQKLVADRCKIFLRGLPSAGLVAVTGARYEGPADQPRVTYNSVDLAAYIGEWPR